MSSGYGPAVKNGLMLYTSPSAIKRALRCIRSWGFRYISRLKDPPGPAAEKGSAGHLRIETYATTGEATLTGMELCGKLWIPKPHTRGVLIEDSSQELLIADIPLVTKLDYVNLTGIYVAPNGSSYQEAFPEFVDWKFTGNFDYAFPPTHPSHHVQVTCYGERVLQLVNASPDHVRQSLVYFSMRGRHRAQKLSNKIPVDELHRDFAGVELHVEAMKEYAKASDPNDLPCNTEACRDFNRDCSFMSVCNRSESDLLRSIQKPLPKGVTIMSIIDLLGAKNAPAEPVPETMAQMTARLVANELAAKLTTQINAVLSTRSTYGLPVFAEPVRSTIASLGLVDVLDGEGVFKEITIADAEKLAELATMCAEKSGTSLTPPDAPVNPTPGIPLTPEQKLTLAPNVLAAVETKEVQHAAAGIGTTTVAATTQQLAQDAQVTIPVVTEPLIDLVESPTFYDINPITLAAAKLSPENRRKKDFVIAVLQDEVNNLLAVTEDKISAQGTLVSADELAETQAMVAKLTAELEAIAAKNVSTLLDNASSDRLEIFVNCKTTDPTEPLESYLDVVIAALVQGGNVKSFHEAPNDHAYAYGKWKGYLERAIIANPPEPGRYSFTYYPDDVLGCALDALRKFGAVIVRGGL